MRRSFLRYPPGHLIRWPWRRVFEEHELCGIWGRPSQNDLETNSGSDKVIDDFTMSGLCQVFSNWPDMYTCRQTYDYSLTFTSFVHPRFQNDDAIQCGLEDGVMIGNSWTMALHLYEALPMAERVSRQWELCGWEDGGFWNQREALKKGKHGITWVNSSQVISAWSYVDLFRFCMQRSLLTTGIKRKVALMEEILHQLIGINCPCFTHHLYIECFLHPRWWFCFH